jgi:hypothetical protein
MKNQLYGAMHRHSFVITADIVQRRWRAEYAAKDRAHRRKSSEGGGRIVLCYVLQFVTHRVIEASPNSEGIQNAVISGP